MRASSDSIAQLAAALAKAQSELVNPAKSLTAVLERGRNGAGAQSYRYAPLSSGLDMVRKAFGKCELALIQTTHVDRERSVLLLTTTIAHGSGEWISGIWPVCHLSDMGHPKLMGAALTYARRYCLFTIVGIAGEDDLDAPDLLSTSRTDAAPNGADPEPLGNATDADRARSSELHVAQEGMKANPEALASDQLERPGRRRRPARITRPSRPSLVRSADPGKGLDDIADADALFRWALEMLPARNKLADSARAAIDAAFLAKAKAVGADPELLIPFGIGQAQSPPKPRPVLLE